jgi:hypothetical protein
VIKLTSWAQIKTRGEVDAETLRDVFEVLWNTKTGAGLDLDVEDTARVMDKLIGTHGVEYVKHPTKSDYRGGPCGLTYLNTGEGYHATLAYDHSEQEWLVTSWADWMEDVERDLEADDRVRCAYCGEWSEEGGVACHDEMGHKMPGELIADLYRRAQDDELPALETTSMGSGVSKPITPSDAVALIKRARRGCQLAIQQCESWAADLAEREEEADADQPKLF